VIDPCVLTEPCWLEEHLVEAGVADQDWTRRIPDPVLDVIHAMYEALMADAYTTSQQEARRPRALAAIAAHFAAAAAHHLDAQRRNDEGDLLDAHELGGPWEPTAKSVGLALEARARRERRKITRPAANARARLPRQAEGLFDLEAS
jgi:hypothetical protein